MTIYNANIPTGLVNLNVDYKNIQNNFSQLDTSFGINHKTFSDNTGDNGKHTFVQMVKSAGIPASLAANEGTVYTKTASAITDLWYTPDNSGNQYQMTRTITGSFGTFGLNTVYPGAQAFEKGGWTFLPGGLIMQYGSVLPGVSTSQTGTTSFPITFTSTPFIVMPTAVTKSGGTSQVRVISITNGSITNTLFKWNWDNGTSDSVGFNWIAIGV